jgi:hypothetical protein
MEVQERLEEMEVQTALPYMYRVVEEVSEGTGFLHQGLYVETVDRQLHIMVEYMVVAVVVADLVLERALHLVLAVDPVEL